MVEKIFTTFSQKLKGIERVSIINFEIKNCLYRIFSFVSIRFVAIILNEKHHMLGRFSKCYSFSRRCYCQRYYVSFILFHSIKRSQCNFHAWGNFIIRGKYKSTIICDFHISGRKHFEIRFMDSVVYSCI